MAPWLSHPFETNTLASDGQFWLKKDEDEIVIIRVIDYVEVARMKINDFWKIEKIHPFNGLTVEEATAKLPEGHSIRITWVDGQPQIGTADARINRLNVKIENGVITEVEGIG